LHNKKQETQEQTTAVNEQLTEQTDRQKIEPGHAVLSGSMHHLGCKKLSHSDGYTRSEREESSSSQWHNWSSADTAQYVLFHVTGPK